MLWYQINYFSYSFFCSLEIKGFNFLLWVNNFSCPEARRSPTVYQTAQHHLVRFILTVAIEMEVLYGKGNFPDITYLRM